MLPAIQFSLPPWEYGEQSADLCRRYAALHTEFAPRIFALAQEATCTGTPIIRPIFWLAPDDEYALTCDDEFLLGDEFLVAPVVTPNTTQRDIYLPVGTWQEYWTNDVFEGAIMLKDYPSPLDTLPIFKKIM